MRALLLTIFLCFFINGRAQLLIGSDTITVIDNNYCLKMPWCGGINAATFSNADLDYDGKNDLVIYDKLNGSSLGSFKCFINVGNTGQAKYKYQANLASAFPHTYNWALLYDYNGDTKADLFISVTGGIQVYKNIGNSTIGLKFQMVYGLLYSNYNPSGPPSVSNIYAGPVGLPAITDIDNDGDLDILTFSPSGIFIEYHKNLSKELFAHADSLRFELADQCWGNISESSCLVNLNQCPSRPAYETIFEHQQKTLHAGASLMAFDSDGDGDKDLIIGDISCSTIEYCHNDGTIAEANITDTTKLYPNYPNKGNTTQMKFNSFPVTYQVDIDNDNVKELIACPNAFGSENATSVWLYKNTSTTNTVNFQFVKNNFLQDEMIDAGQMSRPILFDYNADGKKDLLVGGGGVFINEARRPRFYLYENIGTAAQPSFSLITKDYAMLSSVLNGSIISAVPAPGDIDNDGDEDLFIVTNSNILSWFENTAGAGNTCNFSNFKYNHFLINFPSSDVIPQLFDMDQDGKLDLMVSTKNGRIYYYRNIGTPSVPSFSLVTGAFPNVSLKGDFFVYGLDGYGASFFYNQGAQTKLLGGCITGQIYLYDVPSVVTNSCTLMDSTTNKIIEPTYSTPWFEDINFDGKPDLFVGNAGGGVAFYSSKAPEVGISELTSVTANLVSLYPNPTSADVFLEVNDNGAQIKQVVVMDMMLKQIKRENISNANCKLDVSNLSEGVYILHVTLEKNHQLYYITKKLIKR